jgi:sugar phosphate isomerase/epimerase
MDRFEAVRALYAKAGVAIYAYRLTLTDAMPDDEYEYAFTAARALGADQLTMELPADGRLSQRIGRFAARHRTLAGYHAHTQATLTAWDEALAQSKYNAVQLDVGHYVAGTSASPIPLLRKHHDRIASLHLKDRKRGNHDGGPNMPWGQGDTPIREVLQLMRAERWTFPAAIELEYPVPAGSTRFAEIARCLDYCKQALA